MRADHAKTKDYCMTRFFGHGQSILQVFETSIALSMVKSVKSPFFQTLLVPISWTLAILYDFLRNNDFEVANFNFEQDVSYTYFNTISRSYIDHVFISKDARNTVTACAIVSDLPSNVSDHFPMCTTLGVLVTSKELDIADNGVSSVPNFPRVDWSDNKNCTAYSRYMDVATASLPGVNFDTVTSRDEARKAV